jgi:phosphoglycerate dehydrogenase-like enzyme
MSDDGHEESLQPDTVLTSDPADADAILIRREEVDAELIARAERCLVIVHLGPGCGPEVARVDLEAARRAGIYVASVPDYASDGWATETMDLIDEASMLAGIGPRTRGVRLGIVGLGQVGRRVARLARARGMELWGHDPFCPENPWNVLGVRPAPLEELLGMAQIVSLHAPLGPATRGMLDATRLNLLQRGTALVNAAAPELIDFAPLARAMRRGRPGATVFLMPPESALDAELAATPNVIQRPATAGETPEARREALRRAIDIARRTLRGERPPHLLIDPPCPRQAMLNESRF